MFAFQPISEFCQKCRRYYENFFLNLFIPNNCQVELFYLFMQCQHSSALVLKKRKSISNIRRAVVAIYRGQINDTNTNTNLYQISEELLLLFIVARLTIQCDSWNPAKPSRGKTMPVRNWNRLTKGTFFKMIFAPF